MVKKIRFAIYLLSLSLLLTACTIPSREDAFQAIYPIEDMNRSLRLVFYGTYNRQPPGKLLCEFSVYNQTENIVVFPYDFNVKIFYFDAIEGEWIEEENLNHYQSLDDIKILPEDWDNIEPSFAPFSVNFMLPSNVQVDEVRIVVTGTLLQDGETTGDEVGAYFDVATKR